MFHSIKEKSWSVRLVKGYVLNDQVRALRCENCKSTTEILTTNHNNPNILLYGCKDSKCKHRMLRLDFNTSSSLLTEPLKSSEPKPEVSASPADLSLLAS
ncbi:MAG: hypothetical protein ACM3UY_00605 [Methanocella sp.]